MSDGRNDLTLLRGEEKTHRILVDNPPADGVSGWTFKLYAYPNGHDVTPVISKTTGISASGADLVDLVWAESDSSEVAPGVYPYVLMHATLNVQVSFGNLKVIHGVPS